MNNKFVHRLERAFENGSESRASAASSGGHRMAPIALTDAQLATLRQFATPIPPSLRDRFCGAWRVGSPPSRSVTAPCMPRARRRSER
jgi:hypothetical protein